MKKRKSAKINYINKTRKTKREEKEPETKERSSTWDCIEYGMGDNTCKCRRDSRT